MGADGEPTTSKDGGDEKADVQAEGGSAKSGALSKSDLQEEEERERKTSAV